MNSFQRQAWLINLLSEKIVSSPASISALRPASARETSSYTQWTESVTARNE